MGHKSYENFENMGHFFWDTRYNSHFCGSPIWNLYGKSCKNLLTTYNQSVRIAFDLPLTTHRNLIEPITGSRHLYVILLSRFISFLEKVKKSSKIIPKLLLSHIISDVRSNTGYNLRKILLGTGKDDIFKITIKDLAKVEFAILPKDEAWKSSFITELIDIRESSLEVTDFSDDEINEILSDLCKN